MESCEPKASETAGFKGRQVRPQLNDSILLGTEIDIRADGRESSIVGENPDIPVRVQTTAADVDSVAVGACILHYGLKAGFLASVRVTLRSFTHRTTEIKNHQRFLSSKRQHNRPVSHRHFIIFLFFVSLNSWPCPWLIGRYGYRAGNKCCRRRQEGSELCPSLVKVYVCDYGDDSEKERARSTSTGWTGVGPRHFERGDVRVLVPGHRHRSVLRRVQEPRKTHADKEMLKRWAQTKEMGLPQS